MIHLLHTTNNFFETTTPWKLKKSENPGDRAMLNAILTITMEVLRQTAIVMQPIIPVLTERLLDKLNIPVSARTWEDTKLSFRTKDASLGDQDSILFRRIVPSTENKSEPKQEQREKSKQRKQAT